MIKDKFDIYFERQIYNNEVCMSKRKPGTYPPEFHGFKEKEFVIPDDITSVDAYCFEDWSNLEHVVIPNGVVYLHDSCFYNCSSLNNVVIPASVKRIGVDCFGYCESLKNITFEKGCNISIFPQGCFSGCGFEIFSVPSSVKILGVEAFLDCKQLVSVDCWGIEQVKSYAFEDCPKLRHVYFSKALKELDKKIFYRSKQVIGVVVPNSIERCNLNAFVNSDIKLIRRDFN